MSLLTDAPEVVWAHSNPPRSEVASLRTGMLLSFSWGAVVIVAVVALLELTGPREMADVVLIFVASVLAVCGVTARPRTRGGWCAEAALGAVVLLGFASVDTRMDVLVMGSYCVAFFGIFLSSRTWGLAWIAVGVVLVSAATTRSTDWVTVGGFSINVGWVAVLQALVAGAWLWWAWHAALEAASRRDAEAAEQEQVISDAMALQQRTRAWRTAITRTHETILNDIRYVLRAPTIDRARLRQQLLTTRDRRAAPPDAEDASGLHLPDSLLLRLRAEFPGSVEISGPAERLELAPAELMPALVEIVRNISRHTDATRVEIAVRDHGGALQVSVADDGARGSTSSRTPGIGRSVVMEESLKSLGATIAEGDHEVVITIPRASGSGTAAGRALPLFLSIVLVSSAVGGSPQFLLLLVGASLTFLPVAVAAVSLTLIAAIAVLRGRRVGSGIVIAGAILASVVTWGLVAAQPICASTSLELTTINLSINAFFAILLAASSRWSWALALPALVGVIALDLLPGVNCPIATTDVLLSSAVLMPLLVLMSWLSTRSTARWAAHDRRRWETEITEIARAEAGVDLAQSLGDSVDRAWSQMWDIAEGAELTSDRRRRLRTLESSIRASLQADPRVAGGFVLAARQIVEASGLRETPVHVRALRGSSDARPLPEDFVDRLSDMVSGDADPGASIHVFFDGYDDYLAITLPGSAAARHGFLPGDVEDHGCCLIEVSYVGDEERADTDAEVTVMVSRPALANVPVPA